MSIGVSDSSRGRGEKDARRHREKQKDAIKDNLPYIISNEDTITGKKGKIVKVPIRMLDIPHFRQSSDEDEDGYGVGQGKKQPGDIIGDRPVPGEKKPGDPGQEPGVDYVEAEIRLEELIDMMFDDFGLPRLDEKKIHQILIELGWKVGGRAKFGPKPLLDGSATAAQGYKRFWAFLSQLETETKRDQLVCFGALKEAKGFLDEAFKLLENPNYATAETEVAPWPIIWTEDQRFLKVEPSIQPQSQAVVIAMMDVSGSMDDDKKYLARSALTWLVRVLRLGYEKLELRFIKHHSEAKLTDEHDFFHTAESGGTLSKSAYELARETIINEYPVSSWNVYCFHFSDGEDALPDEAVAELEKLFALGINMFGYGQTNPYNNEILTISQNDLFDYLDKAFGDHSSSDRGLEISVGADDVPYVGVKISKKEDLYPALKEFLKKDRWYGQSKGGSR